MPECYLLQGIEDSRAAELNRIIINFHTNICRDLQINRKDFEKSCLITIAFKDPPTGRANMDVTTLTSTVIPTRLKVKYRATLEILHPDFYDGKRKNLIGHAYNEQYYHKLLIHELSTCHIEYILSNKENGWGPKNIPNWFRQGLEEYYGLMYSDHYWRTDGIKDYFNYHRGPDGGINFQFGIFPQDPYYDGAILFLFLHEYYGSDIILKILISEKRDLGAAIDDVLNINLNQMAEDFQTWLAKK